jgi:hypothetical protein
MEQLQVFFGRYENRSSFVIENIVGYEGIRTRQKYAAYLKKKRKYTTDLIVKKGKFAVKPNLIVNNSDVFGGRERCKVKNGSKFYNCYYNENYDLVMKQLKENPSLAKKLKMGNVKQDKCVFMNVLSS